MNGDYVHPLPRVASGALAQLWRQTHLDERPISGEALRTVARPVSWTCFDAGLSLEELILGVTNSWLAMEAQRRQADTRLARAFAKLVSLCIEEFQFASRASDARAKALDRLQQYDRHSVQLGAR